MPIGLIASPHKRRPKSPWHWRGCRKGTFSNVKCVGSGVHEYRIDFGPGYRMYFGKDGERVVLLLGGGTKKRQQKDIADAHRRWQDYKRRKKLGDSIVALTRDFKETIQARARRDSAFRKELLREAVESFLAGDVETGKTVLRDYIHATVGFNELAESTHHSPKSLMRMLGPSGNPQARNLFEIVHYLQQKERVRFKVHAAAAR